MFSFRWLRIVVAALSLTTLSALFLDFTEIVPLQWHWIAHVQITPAILEFGMIGLIVCLSWLTITLLFGRVYCSVICPLGVVAVNGFGSLETFAQSEKKDGPVDLVAVIGGEPDVLLQKALAELGGITRFVKKGQKVVIKPNIGWDRKAELAANTNPILVGAMVKQCLAAGASEVSVLDHTCDRPQSCYTNSGIEKAVVDAGGKMLPANDERYYRDGDLPDGKKLKKSKFHHALLDCDVWFNIPVLKVHGGIALSMSMKNYMGIVYDRRIFHRIDLAQCIADVCTWSKKPALNIVDAYRVMTANGPKGLSEADCVVAKALIASPDIVATDTAAVRLAEQFTKIKVEDVEQIRAAEELQLGTSKLENLNVRRVRI